MIQQVTGNQRLVADALLWLQSHLQEDINIDDLARALSVSTSHLRRAFVNELGISPKQFLIDMRIEKCKELLLNMDISIKAAAHLSGLSPKHFSRMFRQREGMTPTKWKEKHLG
jgi:two-component system response regulator YesN